MILIEIVYCVMGYSKFGTGFKKKKNYELASDLFLQICTLFLQYSFTLFKKMILNKKI